MLNPLKIRWHQGHQTIPNVRTAAVDAKFPGLPVLNDDLLAEDAAALQNLCPTKAISIDPLRIDLGKCIFCGDCERFCKNGAIRFSNEYKLASTSRQQLIVDRRTSADTYRKSAIRVREEIKRLFGKSLKLRSVSAGGCNTCEMELNACGNVNFDMGRFGIEIVASPRHADGIVITGPISENMAQPLEDAYRATPDPKIVILAGSCAISGGIFAHSPTLKREFLQKYPVDLFVPGCPFHPLTFINGVLDFLGRK